MADGHTQPAAGDDKPRVDEGAETTHECRG
jgi:hypothetical protein